MKQAWLYLTSLLRSGGKAPNSSSEGRVCTECYPRKKAELSVPPTEYLCPEDFLFLGHLVKVLATQSGLAHGLAGPIVNPGRRSLPARCIEHGKRVSYLRRVGVTDRSCTIDHTDGMGLQGIIGANGDDIHTSNPVHTEALDFCQVSRMAKSINILVLPVIPSEAQAFGMNDELEVHPRAVFAVGEIANPQNGLKQC
uniref:Uncharacterized protein n=1 Tax=Talaromyces marneffei PM1 TaxID=1077442 RepID=A0A093VGZ0_TALMA